MILSVYLGSDEKRTPDSDFLVTQFHSLIHRSLSEQQRNKWNEEIERIKTYLHDSVSRSNVRSIVIFAGKKIWQVYNLEFFLPSLLKISSNRYSEPLNEALDKYQKYLVVLVDREKAKLFTVHLGKIEEQKDVFNGEVPQNVKAKKIDWGRDNKIFRHIEQHLDKHLEFIAKAVLEFANGKGIHFIILGGHKEIIPRMKAHLLYPLNKMVKGQFTADLDLAIDKVLIKSKEVAGQVL